MKTCSKVTSKNSLVLELLIFKELLSLANSLITRGYKVIYRGNAIVQMLNLKDLVAKVHNKTHGSDEVSHRPLRSFVRH